MMNILSCEVSTQRGQGQWYELPTWVALCERLAEDIDEAGMRQFEDGIHFDALYEAAVRYAGAMLVISAMESRGRTDIMTKSDITELCRPLCLILPNLIFLEHPNIRDAIPIPLIVGPEKLTKPLSTKPSFEFVLGVDLRPISSSDEEQWLAARRDGVTATDARKLVKLNGQPSVQVGRLLNDKLDATPAADFASFAHGREREPIIARWVEAEFGITPNNRLLHGVNARHLATPDGLGEDCISEIKTSTKPLEKAKSVYRDQLQWQLHVTGVTKLLFVVENRDTFVREHQWIYPDKQRIATLVIHANLLLAQLDLHRTPAPKITLVAIAPETLVAKTTSEPATKTSASLIRPPAPPTNRPVPPLQSAGGSAGPLPANPLPASPPSSSKPNYAWLWIIVAIIVAIVIFRGFSAQAPEGNGYEVTCNDGWVSHSGGLQGACSHHNGEVSP